MSRLLALLFTAIFICGTAPVMAADVSARTCTLTKAFSCTSLDGCMELPVQDMGLPRFFRIDLKNKMITSLDADVPRAPTRIATIEHLEGNLLLQGSEKRGWNMAVGETSGYLTLSATDSEEGFLVFGSCISPDLL